MLVVLGLVVLVLFAIVVITFWPTPVDRPVHREIVDTLGRMHRRGVPWQVNYSVVEFSANVALFLPLGALIALIVKPRLWWLSGVLGLVLSFCVELGQYLFLPQRYASVYDLASNTVGALVGGAIVAVVRVLVMRRRTDKARKL